MFLLQQATHRMLIRYHPEIGHLYVPNLNARIPNELGGYFIRTNSLGFRSDIDFTPTRPDRPRILFFGDSYTAGDGCDNEERFPELVGEMLGAEVFNFGLSGSGTDQQLLILENFARDIQADLIVLGIAVHNIDRIKVSHRLSIDRETGRNLLVPKPYFTLVGDKLDLHNSPVPRERPPAEPDSRHTAGDATHHHSFWLYKLWRRHQSDPWLENMRHFVDPYISHFESRLRSKFLQLRNFNPYPDYDDADSRGWRLMQAILRRFFSHAAPIPVLVVPIPVRYFFLDQLRPTYQQAFETLAMPDQGVHVADVTTPMARLPRSDRERIQFRNDSHFSTFGHRRIAELIAAEIVSRRLLTAGPASPTPVSKGAPSSDSDPASPRPPKPDRQQHKSTYILGISCFYHNSAAALIKDGRIIAAAEEERFTRVKNDRGFPHQAINYCLEEARIHQGELAAIVYYDNAWLTFERLMQTQLAIGSKGKEAWLRVVPSWVRFKLRIPQIIREFLKYEGLVLHTAHHRSHAASAFFPSPFEQAAIVTVDGVGEWATASIGKGRESQVQLLKEMHFPNSLGLLYSAFTQFTGFKVNSGEYKMMGLAPYGDPKYADVILNTLCDLKADGSLELNMDYFAFLSEPTMTNERFADLFDGPPRTPESQITKREMDIAASIQSVTEKVILRMARYAHQLTGEKRLCLSGGVALNCVANGRLLREGPFEEIWIQPAAGDSGSALGAALDVYYSYFGNSRLVPSDEQGCEQGGSYWGPEFSEQEIESFLETHGYKYQHLNPSERASRITQYLDSGKVVGHFSGRAEFGPRSLGSRSILGDARSEETQTTLNLRIKYRESFRPFAPTVLAERVSDYFDLDRESPYMLIVAKVKKERQKPFQRGTSSDLLTVVRRPRSDIPAVTHVDYSARIQTINQSDHRHYYDVVKAFERLTGCGVIVNTSFNVRGEPIVCTPYDAYRCFMRTEMDVLVLGNYLLLKEEQKPYTEEKGGIEEESVSSRPDGDGYQVPIHKALAEIYSRDFLPLSRKLVNRGAVRVSFSFKSAPSMWKDHQNNTPQEIFSIPPELDSPQASPSEMVSAITGFWERGVASESLEPILVKLLKLGMRFPEPKTAREQVSESVYVMY